jgi:hypothetical protein
MHPRTSLSQGVPSLSEAFRRFVFYEFSGLGSIIYNALSLYMDTIYLLVIQSRAGRWLGESLCYFLLVDGKTIYGHKGDKERCARYI